MGPKEVVETHKNVPKKPKEVVETHKNVPKKPKEMRKTPWEVGTSRRNADPQVWSTWDITFSRSARGGAITVMPGVGPNPPHRGHFARHISGHLAVTMRHAVNLGVGARVKCNGKALAK